MGIVTVTGGGLLIKYCGANVIGGFGTSVGVYGALDLQSIFTQAAIAINPSTPVENLQFAIYGSVRGLCASTSGLVTQPTAQ